VEGDGEENVKKKVTVLTLRARLFALGPMRSALCLFGAVLFVLSIPAHAQQPMKVPRIGFLHSSSRSSESARVEAFRQGLRELGYVEGKNIIIDYRYAEGQLDPLPAFVADLVDLKIDVLVTLGTPPTVAAKSATKTIPIVMIAGDAVGVGLVDSLARPRGNITGISDLTHHLSGKRLELLKETVPKLSRVAVLWNPDGPGSTLGWKESQLASRELGLQLHSMAVRTLYAFEGAFEEATRTGNGAVIQTGNPLFYANQKQIAGLAIKHRLPAIYDVREFVEVGGLMSYGPDHTDLYRRAAIYVDKILKGAKSADLPVEQPTKFEFVINLKAAKEIGVTISPGVLMWADRVIK
jgi:putative tryptophan/tyrosine transport system substrate-binding protein